MSKGTTTIVICLAVVILAVFFRFVSLDTKALHHDESVNYAFTKKLVENNIYRYNPTHYHGPFLYFAALPPYWIQGPTKLTLRLMPAIFGLLGVILFLLMRNVIGIPGAIIAAAVVAVSPIDVYFSKTFIHEIYLGCFSVGLLWCFLEFSKKPRLAHLFGFFAFGALCFAVKETSVLMVVALVLAYGGTRLYFYGMEPGGGEQDRMKIDWKYIRDRKIFLADAIGLGVVIWLLLFTSFLTYPQGMLKFFEAFLPWAKTGTGESGHNKPAYYFFLMLAKYYAPIVVPALLTGFWSLGKRRPRGVFLFLYSMLLIIFYSAIPYKTPWCLIHMGLPFVMLGGYGLSKALDPDNVAPLIRGHIIVFLVIAFVPYSYFSWKINFRQYDNDDYKIIYVQTDRAFENMFDLVNLLAENSGQGHDMRIAVINAKNPARFYLKEYCCTDYHSDAPDHILDHPVIIAHSDDHKLEEKHVDQTWEKLDGEYIRINSYPVWPGTFNNLIVKKDFYKAYAKGAK